MKRKSSLHAGFAADGDCNCCQMNGVFRATLADPQRRAVLKGLIAAAVATIAAPDPAPAQTPAPSRLTVFVARKIITMDRGWPEATAVAVQDGRILSVGSLDDLKPWTEGRPHQIDRTFEDKILMPGFIEPHGHPLLGGTSLTRPLLTYMPIPGPYAPPFPGVRTKQAAMQALGGYVAKAASPDETVLAWGYDVVAFGGDMLTRHDLDAVSKTQPILVWDASGHLVFANTAALKKIGITRADYRINGVVEGPDGEPLGQFTGTTAAQFVLQQAIGELMKPDIAFRNTKHLMDLARRNGITTFSELAYGAVNLDLETFLYNKYFNDPLSPMRCVVVSDVASGVALHGDKALATIQSYTAKTTDKLIFNGVKFFADDSFLGLGMVAENPGYTDGRKGIWITPPEKMAEAFRPWWDAGMQIHVHSNGNAGNAATIAALQQLQNEHPRTNHRFTLEHYGISAPEQARVLHDLGGVASVNPFYLHHRAEFNAPYLGTERAYTAARLNTLVEAGVPVSIHSDTPVAPPVPLECAWVAVNRFGLSGKVRGEAERVTVDQALRMITTGAAFTLGVEDRIGSITPGKYADFTILEADPYAVPKEQLRDIKIWGTVVGGRVFPASEITA